MSRMFFDLVKVKALSISVAFLGALLGGAFALPFYRHGREDMAAGGKSHLTDTSSHKCTPAARAAVAEGAAAERKLASKERPEGTSNSSPIVQRTKP